MPEVADELAEAFRDAPHIVFRAVHFDDEDLAQEAREAMWLASKTWDPSQGCSLKRWMRAKAHWRVFDAYRDRTRRLDRPGVTVETRPIEDIPDSGVEDHAASICDAVAARQILAALPKAVKMMPIGDRDVICEFIAGRPQVEIAENFEITDSRVSQIVAVFRRSAAHLKSAHMI